MQAASISVLKKSRASACHGLCLCWDGFQFLAEDLSVFSQLNALVRFDKLLRESVKEFGPELFVDCFSNLGLISQEFFGIFSSLAKAIIPVGVVGAAFFNDVMGNG